MEEDARASPDPSHLWETLNLATDNESCPHTESRGASIRRMIDERHLLRKLCNAAAAAAAAAARPKERILLEA